jgi:hypothetical protein
MPDEFSDEKVIKVVDFINKKDKKVIIERLNKDIEFLSA